MKRGHYEVHRNGNDDNETNEDDDRRESIETSSLPRRNPVPSGTAPRTIKRYRTCEEDVPFAHLCNDLLVAISSCLSADQRDVMRFSSIDKRTREVLSRSATRAALRYGSWNEESADSGFYLLTNLTSLDLHGYRIEACDFVSKFSSLKTLRLLGPFHHPESRGFAWKHLTGLTCLEIANTFDCRESIVSKLTGLERFSNMGLCLGLTLNALTSLKNLSDLEITHSQSLDAKTVASMSRLTRLIAFGARNDLCGALSSLTRLSTLALGGRLVSPHLRGAAAPPPDAGVSELTNLTDLSLRLGASLGADDRSLRSLTLLSRLELIDKGIARTNGITDASVSRLTSLRSLTLFERNRRFQDAMRITDSSLFALSGLTELVLKNAEEITEASIRSLSHLKRLSVSRIVLSPDTFDSLPNLLRFETNRWDNCLIDKLANLTDLRVRKAFFLSDDHLSRLSSLRCLRIAKSQSITCEALSSFCDLRRLCVYKCCDFVLNDLAPLRNLERVDVRSCSAKVKFLKSDANRYLQRFPSLETICIDYQTRTRTRRITIDESGARSVEEAFVKA